MRRLLVLFVVFAALGAAVALVGLMLARSERDGSSGRRVVSFALAQPLEEYAAGVDLPLVDVDEALHLEQLWRALSAARVDDDVVGVAVKIDDAAFGLAKAQELRRLFQELDRAGKRVACYLDTAGEGSNGTLDYYVASACSEVSLSPAGELNLLGLYADSLFLRGTLDKAKIEPSFLAAGTYKSAAESFTERAHTPAAREALDALLDDYFAQIVVAVGEARGLPPETVRERVDQAPLSAAVALEARLVDRIEYPDEFRARVESELATDDWQELSEYAGGLPVGGRGPELALVFASGTIVRGGGGVDSWSGERFLGSDDLGATLARLTDDDDVAAVVLRIDSPGGSAVASDLLLRRVELLARAKPVVVSMSDLAASGGYYIAAKATRIVAEPGTLTGSIGVVMGKLATARAEEEHLGATRDPLARGVNAGLYSSARPFDERERALLGRRLQETYARFVEHVASGRSLPAPDVERVAQGRVWSGEDALRHGLVDELGGLDRALELARELAGLDADEGVVTSYPRSKSLLAWLRERPEQPFARAGWAPLVRLVRETRAPFELELPFELRALAQPF